MEYVSVPLPTNKENKNKQLDETIKKRRTPKKSVTLYTGTDGGELAVQPRAHRKHWTDEQWVAFREFQQLETEMASTDEPVAAAMIIKN